MLLRANCVRDRDCKNCDFESECIVRRTMYSKYEIVPRFVTTNDSVGYILECENYDEEFYEGDTLQFQLIYLEEQLCIQSVYAGILCTGHRGNWKEHAQYRIKSVTNTQNESLFDNSAVYMKNYNVQTLDSYVKHRMNEMNSLNCQNRLVFHTPATLKYQGKFLETYDMEAIWNAILRRIYMLECFEGLTFTVYDVEELKGIMLPDIVEQKIRTISVQRYSSTQDRKCS